MTEWLAKLLATVAFGAASAVIPVFNGEAYVLGVGITGVLNPLTAGLALAVGQTIGKVALLWMVRYRPWRVTRKPELSALDLDTRFGRMRQSWRYTAKRLLDLVGDSRCAIPVTFLAALVGVPPLYAVALLAGASRIPVMVFAPTVLAGRTLRFIAIALGASVL